MYHVDSYDNSIVLDGVENGIADSPYSGISNLQNVNITSIPGEASVNFSTAKISPPSTGNVVVDSLNSDAIGFSGGATGLENGMAITFSSVGSLTGLNAGSAYWVTAKTGTPTSSCKLFSDFEQTIAVSIGGTTAGSPTFSSVSVKQPKHFTYDNVNGTYWMIDSSGQVWSNSKVTSPSSYWTYAGNTEQTTGANGNGLVYLQTSADGANIAGYLFAFRNSRIDYVQTAGTTTLTWVYNWRPSTGTISDTNYLKTSVGANNSHEAFVAPDNRVYYCDANWIGRFYQKAMATLFNPKDNTTYVFDETRLLPETDIAQCLSFLGTNVMVGGQNNIVYPWNRFDPNYTFPILLPENYVSKMVTVNTNTYIFAGNRGNIYVTNGSQVQLYKKIPDHISGTVEPYFIWGGACFQKKQLYFSFYSKTNSGTYDTHYGGVWAIDLNTESLRLTNQLSYDSYAGYATALIAQRGESAIGTGLFIGWVSDASSPTTTGGIDITSSNPYTDSQAVIEYDLIPIGTFNKPRDSQQMEFKLSKPLVAGESINLYTRTDFSQNYGTVTFTTSPTTGDISGSAPVNFKQAQWLQVKAIINSTVTNPSYVRLKEIRLTGFTK